MLPQRDVFVVDLALQINYRFTMGISLTKWGKKPRESENCEYSFDCILSECDEHIPQLKMHISVLNISKVDWKTNWQVFWHSFSDDS